MGFTCNIMPFLKAGQEHIKFACSCNTFVCDSVGALKMCSVDLYILYCDLQRYNDEQFKDFTNFVDCSNDENCGHLNGLMQLQTFNIFFLISKVD
jgi:hypothetical protein